MPGSSRYEALQVLGSNPCLSHGMAACMAYHVQRNVSAVNDLLAERTNCW